MNDKLSTTFDLIDSLNKLLIVAFLKWKINMYLIKNEGNILKMIMPNEVKKRLKKLSRIQ